MAVDLIAVLTITHAVVGVLLWHEERWRVNDPRAQPPTVIAAADPARALPPVELPPTAPPRGADPSNYVSPLF